jgi:hypothetical protein
MWGPEHHEQLRAYGIHWGPTHILLLRSACDGAGLIGEDQDTALQNYLDRGGINVFDRKLMDAATMGQRMVHAVERWGSDGGRVGLLAYTDGIGGRW